MTHRVHFSSKRVLDENFLDVSEKCGILILNAPQ